MATLATIKPNDFGDYASDYDTHTQAHIYTGKKNHRRPQNCSGVGGGLLSGIGVGGVAGAVAV